MPRCRRCRSVSSRRRIVDKIVDKQKQSSVVCEIHGRVISKRMLVDNLRQSSQFRLLNLLTQVAPNNVQKDLVIHEDLMKPLDQVAGARLLR